MSSRNSDVTPGQFPLPARTATSISSTTKSTSCREWCSRRSISGCSRQKRASRLTSHFEEKAGVSDTERLVSSAPRCKSRMVTAIRSKDSLSTGRELLPLFGQEQLASQPVKQLEAELFLQSLDLMTDRGLGHVQFVGSLGETQASGTGLEGAKGIQWRKAAHFNLDPYNKISNP